GSVDCGTYGEQADEDHAPAFWSSIAAAFKNDYAVIMDLDNEPHQITWSCWLNGCNSPGFQTAGMQQLLDNVRKAGFKGPVMVEGLHWGHDLGSPNMPDANGRTWLQNKPTDSAHQLVASIHQYAADDASAPSTWDSNVGTVAAQYPVVS